MAQLNAFRDQLIAASLKPGNGKEFFAAAELSAIN